MYNSIIPTCFSLLLCGAVFAQPNFSTRLDLGYPAMIITGLKPVGQGYGAVAVVADSIAPYRGATVYLSFDAQGQLQGTGTPIRHPDKHLECWWKAASLSDGGMVSMGYAFTPEGMKGLLCAFDSAGQTRWVVEQERLVDSVSFFSFTDVVLNGDDLLVAGYHSRRNNALLEYDILLLKYDVDGNLVDYSAIPVSGFRGNALSIRKLDEQTLLIGGYADNLHSNTYRFDTRSALWALDTLGNVRWHWKSPAHELQQGVLDMLVLEDGSIIVASGMGTEVRVNATSGDLRWEHCIYKLSPTRQRLWLTRFRHAPPVPEIRLNRLIPASDGSGYVAVGNQVVVVNPGGNPELENVTDNAGIIVKVSPEGDSLWSRPFIHPGLVHNYDYHALYDIVETPDGGFLLSGESNSLDAEPVQQGWLVKVDEWGCLVPGCHLVSSVVDAGQLEAAVLLYPNPVNDLLNVYLGPGELPSGSVWYLYDAKGKEVLQKAANIPDATYMMDVAGLPPGGYFLQLRTATGKVLASEAVVIQ